MRYGFIPVKVTVYPKKYAHGFVVLCFVVVMQPFIMNSYEVFIHIHQGCFAGTGAIVRLPQCQWSEPDGYGKISQCITTIKHSKAKTVCIFLGIYYTMNISGNPTEIQWFSVTWELWDYFSGSHAGYNSLVDIPVLFYEWNIVRSINSSCFFALQHRSSDDKRPFGHLQTIK